MSSAWSQGTSFRRSVTVPVTVSLVTTLKLVKSAMTCSSARTSMFWKFSAQLFAAVARALGQLVGVDLGRPHFEHELVVGLVGAVFPVAGGLDHHAHAVAALEGGDGLDRRAEVGDVQAPAQCVGQRGLQELDHQVWRLAGGCPRPPGPLGQADDHAAGAVGAAAEVDVAQTLRIGRRLRTGGKPVGCGAALPMATGRCWFPARPAAPCPATVRGSPRPA